MTAEVGIGNLFWLFFIIITLQPVLRQKLLETARKRLLTVIEGKRGSRVISLIHRQETMSFIGFPILRYIDIDDSEEILRAIHMTDPDVPIDLILHTPGGLVLAATQIAAAIADRKGKVTVFVPHYAMSGGTLIALAADEIVMSPHAVLGPVDPQLGQFPAASLIKVMEQKPIKEIDDQTVILADQAAKAIAQVGQSVEQLLSRHMPTDKAAELARLLSSGKWTHDYAITLKEAKEMGLPVSSEMPEDVLKLLQLYPQPMRRRPTVEYVPHPYHSHRGEPKR
ncbi:MAG: ATP-dependent Clp protease proteolytic subunit [Sedimentisphaerales bacterium]